MWLDVSASCLINVFTINSHFATKAAPPPGLPSVAIPSIYLPHPHTKSHVCVISVLASWSWMQPKETHLQFVGVVHIRSWAIFKQNPDFDTHFFFFNRLCIFTACPLILYNCSGLGLDIVLVCVFIFIRSGRTDSWTLTPAAWAISRKANTSWWEAQTSRYPSTLKTACVSGPSESRTPGSGPAGLNQTLTTW